MMIIIAYLLLGLAAGVFSGLVGVGGGVIIVPALVYLFNMSQHQAQGTTLALLVPPIGLLAALTYYKQGFVDIRVAAFICAGFFLGALFGARAANNVSDSVLRQLFGVVLLLMSMKMIFLK
jgi:uncharacterized membrane protein YfcA